MNYKVMIKYIKKIVAVVLLLALFIGLVIRGVQVWGLIFFGNFIVSLVILAIVVICLIWVLDD